MDIFLDVVIVTLMTVTSIGVGASTLVIASFFVALYDGQIDPSERRMLGVIYWLLRYAMVMIAVAMGLVTWFAPETFYTLPYFWALVAVLFVNAFLMTKHWISPKLGPAIQAGTWYTVGFLHTIELFNMLEITPLIFLSLYAVDILFMLLVVNGYLTFVKKKN